MRTRSSSGLALLGLTGMGLYLSTIAPAHSSAQPDAARPPAPIRASRDQWGTSFAGEFVFTKPRQDAAMGFTLSTQVMEVACRAGDRVAAGQLLVRGDDREEMSRLVQQAHRADSLLQIERAQAAADLAEIEHNRTQESFTGGGANQLELDRSRLAMVTARVDVQIARWSQQQEKYLAELTQARVDRFRLVAPFDGIVDVVNVDLGDAVRETDPVVRVVDLSEIWMDVPTSPQTVGVQGLHPGSSAWALIDVGDQPVVVRGTIIYISPTADFASGKHTVRVSVANTAAFPSGLAAWVRYTEPSAEWMSRIVAAGQQGGGVSDPAIDRGLARSSPDSPRAQEHRSLKAAIGGHLAASDAAEVPPAPSVVSQSLADTSPARGGGENPGR